MPKYFNFSIWWLPVICLLLPCTLTFMHIISCHIYDWNNMFLKITPICLSLSSAIFFISAIMTIFLLFLVIAVTLLCNNNANHKNRLYSLNDIV
jgi:hypothetical protein